MTDIKKLDSQYIAPTYGRADLCLDHGKGSTCFDVDGKKYIDLGAGIAVNGFGFCDEEYISAVTEQLSKIQHTSNLYYTAPQAKLAELLCIRTGMKKVFFSNSGAEANECAIKAARKYSSDKYGDGRNVIITLKESFHGRTLTTISATGQDHYHTHFGPFTEGFVHAEANDIDDLKKLLSENKCCGIMIELIQGEGGVNNLCPDYVKEIEKICKEEDILLIIDEVQTGNGRTGFLYAYQGYGISPDIVSTAKGLGGGLPIGATMFSDKVKDTLVAGTHGSTFGGNPIVCAGAYSVMKRIDDKLLSEVRRKSQYIIDELKDAKGVKSVSGMGFMLGIETEKPNSEILKKCMERGVIVLTAKHKVRLLPALTITDEELKEAIKILKEVIASI